MSQFDPRCHDLNKPCRGSLSIATCKISKLKALWSRRIFFKFSLYVILGKTAKPQSGANLTQVIMIWTKVWGSLGNATLRYKLYDSEEDFQSFHYIILNKTV